MFCCNIIKLKMSASFSLLVFVLLILIEHAWLIDGYDYQYRLGQPETVASAAATLPAAVTHRLAKRMDLEMCIGHFDIHKNTIIRTGESQAIGGKYLQGLELETIEECERLCCETVSCDVYIFESKLGGYCYLFECGPPENFHCKFTRHSNYTSSVLTPQVRHVTEMTTPRPQLPHIGTTNISQQEWELRNLKVKPEMNDKIAPAIAPAVGVSHIESAAASVPVLRDTLGYAQKVTPPMPPNVTAHCGRFQFTCHSGECIAVYNACDGIPQCEDGSDEGPECNSMGSSSSGINNPKVNTENQILNKPIMISQYQQPDLAQQQQQMQTQQHQQQQQIQVPGAIIGSQSISNNREDASAWENRKIISDTQQNQQQVEIANTADLNSHFFNHKGGLQLINGQTNSQKLQAYGASVAGSNANPMYAVPLQRNGIYLPQPIQQQQAQLQPQSPPQPQQTLLTSSTDVQQQQQSNLLIPPSNIAQWQQHAPPQTPLIQQQQELGVPLTNTGIHQLQPAPAYVLNAGGIQSQQMLQMQSIPSKTMVNNQMGQMTQGVPQSKSIEVLSDPTNSGIITKGKQKPNDADNDADQDYDYYEEISTEPPKKKQRKHKKVKSKQQKNANIIKGKDPIELSLEQQKHHTATSAVIPVAAPAASALHEQYKNIHDNLAIEFRDHDGHSERPGGAVLSLSLGLLITAALAILIVCRVRTVGRRARRLGGKAPYSQEADFLVNGMYL